MYSVGLQLVVMCEFGLFDLLVGQADVIFRNGSATSLRAGLVIELRLLHARTKCIAIKFVHHRCQPP